jgi:hypothetical protein
MNQGLFYPAVQEYGIGHLELGSAPNLDSVPFQKMKVSFKLLTPLAAWLLLVGTCATALLVKLHGTPKREP